MFQPIVVRTPGLFDVRQIDQLDRGYESLDCKLRTLGAIIERVPEPAFLAERPLSAAG